MMAFLHPTKLWSTEVGKIKEVSQQELKTSDTSERMLQLNDYNTLVFDVGGSKPTV